MRFPLRVLVAALLLLLLSCGGGNKAGGGSTPPTTTPQATRPFMMGTSVFFATPGAFPNFVFENLGDKDLLSIHVDDFWGVPWTQCAGAGCSNLPSGWAARWQQLAAGAKASGKTLYLAVSPLSGRRTLAGSVQADGSALANWLAASAVDGNGCYQFASDSAAASYRAAYVNYLQYLIDLVHPQYLSPAIEMNMAFTLCPSQKAAWIAWYGAVYSALKAANPSLVVFPTFQTEYLYGQASAQAACASGTNYDQCFAQRLAEALAIPGDRLALSTYPLAWKYSSYYGYGYPTDMLAKASQAAAAATPSRRVWISETGYATVPVHTTYAHASAPASTCSASMLVPATLATPSGTIDLATEAAQAAYIAWLLGAAQSQNLEAVVWWLNRDYLDANASATCPCSPSTSDTCTLAEEFYTIGGDASEQLLRIFGNMALRGYGGTPRAGYSTWSTYVGRPLQH